MLKALSLSLELECPETKIGPRQTPPSRRDSDMRDIHAAKHSKISQLK